MSATAKPQTRARALATGSLDVADTASVRRISHAAAAAAAPSPSARTASTGDSSGFRSSTCRTCAGSALWRDSSSRPRVGDDHGSLPLPERGTEAALHRNFLVWVLAFHCPSKGSRRHALLTACRNACRGPGNQVDSQCDLALPRGVRCRAAEDVVTLAIIVSSLTPPSAVLPGEASAGVVHTSR